MRIGELATRAGVSPQAVRFYERSGLIDCPVRTEAGYRDYDRRTVALLLSIKRAQDLGFTLQEIKVMRDLHGNTVSLERARLFAAEKLRAFDEKIASLRKMKKELMQSLRRAEEKRGCPAAPRPSAPRERRSTRRTS